MKKAIVVVILYVAQLWVYCWLLGIICRAWHFPFWGIFWVLTLFEAFLVVDRVLDFVKDRIDR